MHRSLRRVAPLTGALALVLAALASGCGGADDSVVDRRDNDPPPAPTTAPTTPPTAPPKPEPPAPGPTPVPANDADGEPTVAELAVDPGQNAECKGPFNCFLPNPQVGERNRFDNPRTGTDQWPIASGTGIFDGIGGKRGTVTSTTIKINFGQRKMIAGVQHVYAFSVLTTNDRMSSWVPESAVQDPLTTMPTAAARDPGKGDYNQVFTITGGDPKLYGDAKVTQNSTSNNEAASDYLVRPGNVNNMLYSLPRNGGVSNDTYPTSGAVQFRRARGVASSYVYLYTKGTSDVIGTQRYVYGHIAGRYGWIARDALSPAAATPGPTMTFCCAQCSDRAKPHRVQFASDCTTSAMAYCQGDSSRGAYVSASIANCAP